MNEKSNGNGNRKWLWTLTLSLVAAGLMTIFFAPKLIVWAQAGNNGSDDVSTDIQTIQNLVAAFNAKDVDKIMTFFVEDEPVYHNMPGPPVKGTEGVRNLINMFVSSADSLDWEILNIAQSGNTVLAERIDRFVIKGKDVALPCNGAFEMRDGKIAEWRDYFDMATWQKQNAQ